MREEVRRNINYSMISRCQHNGEDHVHDYKLLYKKTFVDYLSLRNLLKVLVTAAILALAYGIYLMIKH